jgi:hypothetical protein
VAQENRHLTTEQLSAYLDEQQLSAEEQSQLDVHLKTCERCQQELTDLRQTVALLHALPRPALPRSFVLPLDIQSVGDHVEDEIINEAEESELVPIPLAAAYSRTSVTSTAKRTRRWPTYVRTTLRAVSAIAAVLGLVLFLSGVLTSFQGGARNTASTMSKTTSGSAQSANVASSKDENSNGATKPQISPSSQATITPPAPSPTAEASTAVKSTGTPVTGQKTFNAAEPTQSQSPTILFFDLSTGPGRLGFGFLLLLLGVMGYVVFKRRWQQELA